MGVTGLWTVLQPCARPIKIETLNKKRLAVDASIWIYQFLKAVRDKEGNALRNSHIVGFFRRICKLLFFGIKPVFVFDGGAPALKRQTINNRKSRREGRREDAVRTAGKLLAVQMQRAAEDEEKRRKEAARHPREEVQEEIPENIVYAEEVFQTQQERLRNRKFTKKDQYHLPDLGVSLAEMGGPNDPRIMSLEELEEYARQFDTGEDINVYDFSKIDFDSPFFTSLPPSDRYNILNAARLRSRLRLGYSKDQLDAMFPDRMAFSKFQIERVRERNELTQRLMNLNGMNDDALFGTNGTNRIAGERGREYVLVKNDGVEGGWALGVVTNKDEGKANKPIDVDHLPPPESEDEEWEDDDDFEDVPIEGLNRLPKPKPGLTARDREGRDFISKELAKRRQKFYNSRNDKPANKKVLKKVPVSQDPDSLFMAEDEPENWEHVPMEDNDDLFEDKHEEGDDEAQQLQEAIALSLQQGEQDHDDESEEDIYREVFQQERAKETNPFSSAKSSGVAIARLTNQRSNKSAPAGPFNSSDSEDDDMDLQAALIESRKSKRPTTTQRPLQKPLPKASPPVTKPTLKPINAPGFDGPLPFEKLNLGSSLLGKKKMQKMEEANSGGFEKDTGSEKKTTEPLPPWFSRTRNLDEDLAAQRQVEKQEWERARKEDAEQYRFQKLPRLGQRDTQEVIDLEVPSTQETPKEILTINSDNESDMEMEDVIIGGPTLRMNDLAEAIQTELPQPLSQKQVSGSKHDKKETGKGPFAQDSDEEPIEWSESEPEEVRPSEMKKPTELVGSTSNQVLISPSTELEDLHMQKESANAPNQAISPSPEFEDVPIETQSHTRRELSPAIMQSAADLETPLMPHGMTVDENFAVEIPDNDSDQYSDPEDADLFASLAAEAEEHARFAQELTNDTTTRIDFDQELKQLRAQQKKDRRDADEVTQTMISECQHLLTLFGLPYITAPMEAEAQCAELVHLGLVDGIVTDDSDTFLFGGNRVYKNMFNTAKFVECYLANDLTSEFALTREKLIDIAQLLGSDYTAGIPGIGPVTALEILSEFSTLQEFKDWWAGVQGGTIPKDADKSSQFRRRFRRTQGTKLFLPPVFPDTRVAEAYLEPNVDSDPQPFQWGVPDLDALRTFLSTQIGWSWERTDEVLVPVIKDMNRREKEGTQSNITRFFEGSVGAGAFAPRIRGGGGPSGATKGKGAAGKRLGAALTRLAEREKSGRGNVEDAGENAEGENNEAAGATSDSGNKRRRKGGGSVAAAAPEDDFDAEEDNEDDEGDELYAEPVKKRARRTRKKKA